MAAFSPPTNLIHDLLSEVAEEEISASENPKSVLRSGKKFEAFISKSLQVLASGRGN